MEQKSYTSGDIEFLLTSVAPNLRHCWECHNLTNKNLIDIQRKRELLIAVREKYKKKENVFSNIAGAVIFFLLLCILVSGFIAMKPDFFSITFLIFELVVTVTTAGAALYFSSKIKVTEETIAGDDCIFRAFEKSVTQLNPMMDDWRELDINGVYDILFRIALEQVDREHSFDEARFNKDVHGRERLKELVKELDSVENYYHQANRVARQDFGLEFERKEIFQKATREWNRRSVARN